MSDITGVTGVRILRAIVAGERDPAVLAQHRDDRCHASEATIVGALTGHYRPEHLFVLAQNLALYDECQRLLAACDQQLQTIVPTDNSIGRASTAAESCRRRRNPRPSAFRTPQLASRFRRDEALSDSSAATSGWAERAPSGQQTDLGAKDIS